MDIKDIVKEAEQEIAHLAPEEKVAVLVEVANRAGSMLRSALFDENARQRAFARPEPRFVYTSLDNVQRGIEETLDRLAYAVEKDDTRRGDAYRQDPALIAHAQQVADLRLSCARPLAQLQQLVDDNKAQADAAYDRAKDMAARIEKQTTYDTREAVYQEFEKQLAALPLTPADVALVGLVKTLQDVVKRAAEIRGAYDARAAEIDLQTTFGAFDAGGGYHHGFKITLEQAQTYVPSGYLALNDIGRKSEDYSPHHYDVHIRNLRCKRDEAGHLVSRSYEIDENGTIGMPSLHVKETFKQGVRRKAEIHAKQGSVRSSKRSRPAHRWESVHHFDPTGQLGRDDGYADSVIEHEKGKLHLHHHGHALHCLSGPARHGIDRAGHAVEEYFINGVSFEKDTFHADPAVRQARSIGGRLQRLFNAFTNGSATVYAPPADIGGAERALTVANILSGLPPDVRRGAIERFCNAYPDYAGADFTHLRDANLQAEAKRNYAAMALQDAVTGIARKQGEFLKIGAAYTDAPAIGAVFQASADELEGLKSTYAVQITTAEGVEAQNAVRNKALDTTLDKIQAVLGSGGDLLPVDQMGAIIARAVEDYASLPNAAEAQYASFVVATDEINNAVEAAAAKLGLRANELGNSLRTVGAFVERDAVDPLLRPVVDAPVQKSSSGQKLIS